MLSDLIDHIDPCTLPVWFDDYLTKECGLHAPGDGRWTYTEIGRAIRAFRGNEPETHTDVLRLANEQAMIEIHRTAEIVWALGRPLAVHRLIGDAFDRAEFMVYEVPTVRLSDEMIEVQSAEFRLFYKATEKAPGEALR